MDNDTNKMRNVEKMATEGQNTQPTHQLDGNMPKNPPNG